ncbi:MAG TPA: hypothetical protein ENG83_10370 [Nitrospirae bacterium]|nr:ATP-dependent helicase/nuclease subunit A [bacterium BMS3Abin06]HDH12578.1 hypothetical protein [Nitrospirota bacterium]HDZ00989.1 hypothetical protein [Nitrospirota bacterium]
MYSYLDTDKSVIISSPAGSGKTEKLARRYIALLQKGVDVERILAITFTDKAAAEMKQRILRILRDEDEGLFLKLLEKMPLMRVSTIHSFCGTLLRRFSFEASIDPNYMVEDAIDSDMIWEEILYEVLMDAGRGSKGHEIFLQTLSEKGFRGLDYLQNTVNYLFRESPFSLESQPFRHTSDAGSLMEELRSWQGVSDLIEDYEDFFKEGTFEGKKRWEKYFLTEKKEPRKRPVPLLKNIADYRDWASRMHMFRKDRLLREYVKRTGRIMEIYRKCLARYTDIKKAKGILDFSDLEYLAYKMLTENPEWANILYAFDEKTDHILVDEFQDTNTFQWAIINKLTEEWRSGLGAKREEGIRPTMFFVGDEKQSIYYFRGANVEIFRRAKEKLETWLGNEFYYEEIKENYRSRPAIIEFTNRVFSKIMQAGEESPSWITRYSPFSAYRTGIPDAGRVELILLDDESLNMQESKQNEADILAQRIKGLAGDFRITDRNTQQQRPCRYMDMALLLRKRTHLKKYEEVLRRYNIPFVAVKGIGFYQEPEVAMLRAFIFFLSNPRDDYSLYILLKSPLFHMQESGIIRLINSEGDSLFEKMKDGCSTDTIPPLVRGGAGGVNPVELLTAWLSQLPYTPVSVLIEQALTETKAWRYFHEAQRKADIKKFIRIMEDLEANGKSILKIRDFLERTCNKNEEPKANVNTEGMDAVKIMTIHAAKGLEFPVVFVPGIEEPFTFKTGENLVYEKDGKFFFKSEPESSIRKQDEDFLIHQAKEEEEQKRLFYVAVTRAEEALFLISRWSSRERSFLSFLRQGLGLEKQDASYVIEADLPGFSILRGEDVRMRFEHAPGHEADKKPLHPVEVTPMRVKKQAPWKAVTETVDIKRQHGKDWVVLGDIMHRIFEGVSKGILQERDIRAKAGKLLDAVGILKEEREEKILMIERDIAALKSKGIWQDIVAPKKDSFSELPFIYEEDNVVYTGRIDRVITEGDIYRIYDYKTFPVREKDTGYLLKEYSGQLNMYKRAVKKLFNPKQVKSFILFTHTGDVREV